MNLFCCFKQSDQYSDQWNLFQCYQYNSDDADDSDDFINESISNILNASQRHCNNNNTQFCFEEVNFFNLHLNIKNYGADNIVNIDEKIYFWNVYLFIVFFKNVAHIKINKVIHWNLNKYLRNIVQN